MADNTQVNYDLLATYEKRFQETGAEAMDQVAQFRQRVDGLHGQGWVGKAADQFHEEMTGEIIPALQRMGEAFNEAAEALKKIREAFNSADEECRGYFDLLGE